MRRTLATFVTLAFLLGVFAAGCNNQGPTGKAVGTVKRSAEFVELEKSLWGTLATYEGAFLKTYATQLQAAPDDPMKLLAAFDELMYAVTGPSGLWRSYVPRQYFGCAANHDLAVCQQFQKLELSFFPWEIFHVQMSSIQSPQEAEAFLSQYNEKLKQYIEYYVPKDKSLTAIQTTPFFQDQLSIFLPQ